MERVERDRRDDCILVNCCVTVRRSLVAREPTLGPSSISCTSSSSA